MPARGGGPALGDPASLCDHPGRPVRLWVPCQSALPDNMIIYYQDSSVQVTSQAIQVDGAVYPLHQLTRVWHEQDQRSWRELAGRGVWSMTYLLPFAGALIGFIAAFTLDISAGARVTVVVAAVLVGLSAGPLIDPILGKMDESFDRGLYRHRIWVELNGLEVQVLETRDAARFGRIYRALQRAAEP